MEVDRGSSGHRNDRRTVFVPEGKWLISELIIRMGLEEDKLGLCVFLEVIVLREKTHKHRDDKTLIEFLFLSIGTSICGRPSIHCPVGIFIQRDLFELQVEETASALWIRGE